MNDTFSIKESFSFAWETFLKRPWFFVGVVLGVLVITGVISAAFPSDQSLVGVLLNIVVGTFIEMGLITVALAARDNVAQVTWGHLWAPKMFLPFFVANLLVGLIVIVGLVLLIIPGVIAAVGLMFTKYLIIDRELGPIEAIKESWAIAKDNILKLIGLLLLIILMNVLGGIVVLGLLVTVPLTMLIMAFVYRELSHNAHEVVAKSAPEQPAAA